MRRSGAKHPHAGFTLIELVMALSLMGLLTGITVSAWRIGVNAQEKVARKTAASRREAAVADFVIAQMRAAVPMRMRNAKSGRGVLFVGTPTSMLLVSRYSLAQRTRAGLVLAGYKMLEADGRRSLVYSERRIASQSELDQLITGSEPGGAGSLQDSVFAPGETWVSIIDDLADGRFEYFGKPQVDAVAAWQGSWDGSFGRMPQGVSIRWMESAAPSQEITIAADLNSAENRDRPLPLYLF